MIKNIKITNQLGESLLMELTRPEKSGFVIKSITGLGPTKANINITNLSSVDGGVFNSARKDTRNVVIDLLYFDIPGKSIEELRLQTYKYFPVKQKIKFEIETDEHHVYADCYVESNEPNIFAKSSGTQISLISPDAFFYDLKDETSGYFASAEGMFEFEFEIEKEGFIFGELKDYVDKELFYDGDNENGVQIHIIANGSVSNVVIVNETTKQRMDFDCQKLEQMTGSGLKLGDNLIINTVKGHKSAILMRDGIEYNVLNCIARGSEWITVSKGYNTIVLDADEGKQSMDVYITYRIAYEGV